VKDLSRTILLVEDNDDDAFMFKRALKKSGIMNPLHVATDGRQALDYLGGRGNDADLERHPRPFIAFIDLKLPYIDGFEILEWIGRQPSLSTLIAIVLSSSNQNGDQEKAYALGARSYLIKPPSPEDILRLMKSLESFWDRTEGGEGPLLMEKRNL
jgi:CheY-like chemotaxis protein